MGTTIIDPNVMVGHYGNFLRNYDWDLFATLTFDPSRGHESATSREQKLNEFLTMLERQARAQVRFFWLKRKGTAVGVAAAYLL